MILDSQFLGGLGDSRGDGQALSLSPAEMVRMLVGQMAQFHQVQGELDLLFHPSLFHSDVPRAKPDLFDG
jgi:hypothetical protein